MRTNWLLWWVSRITPLADDKQLESREGLTICNSQWCSLTNLDSVTFAVFTFSPPDRTQCVWRGDAHRGWNSRNDCLDLGGLLTQAQVKAPRGPHSDHSIVPELGSGFQGFCFFAGRANTSRVQICVFIFGG